MAPVKVAFFCCPNPTTTTSLRPVMFSSNLTFITELFPQTISAGLNPRQSKTKMFPSFAFMEYFPATSVMVPDVVPFTVTAAPGTGSPSESVTVPETSSNCWADNDSGNSDIQIRIRIHDFSFFFDWFILDVFLCVISQNPTTCSACCPFQEP